MPLPVIFVPPTVEKAFMNDESHCFFIMCNYVCLGNKCPWGDPSICQEDVRPERLSGPHW